jgi:hypothetical protein
MCICPGDLSSWAVTRVTGMSRDEALPNESQGPGSSVFLKYRSFQVKVRVKVVRVVPGQGAREKQCLARDECGSAVCPARYKTGQTRTEQEGTAGRRAGQNTERLTS